MPVLPNPGPLEPSHAEFRYRELEGDITQTQLSFGWRTPGTLHPDTPLLELAGTMLGSGRGSRLYRAVRERKLATSVSAYDYTPTELGVFVIHAEGPPEHTVAAARNVWAQLADVRANGFTSDELNRARQLLEARFVRRLETMEGQANFLAEWEALGDWQMGERELTRLMTATADEVSDAVRRHLTEESAGVIVYRPRGAEAIATDAPAMRALLNDAGATPLAPVPAPSPVAPAEVGRARFEREEGRVRVYRTTSDVPILVMRRPGAPILQLGVHVAGGATEEPASRAGLTSLLTRTSVKGTRTRSAAQIAEDGELLGGSVSGGTGAESFSWAISVPVRHADAALELLADVVQHPTFEQAALETERALAIADLEMLRDDMYRYPLRLLKAAAFAGHPYGVPASGTEESLASIGASEVREWHRARVLEGSSVIAIVGDVEPDEIAAIAAARFGELRWREEAPLPIPQWPAAPTMHRRVARQGAERARAGVPVAGPRRRRAHRRGAARRRGERTRGTLLRSAARPSIARVHGERLHRRVAERGDVHLVHRDGPREGGGRARGAARRVRKAARGAGDECGARAGEGVRDRYARHPVAERRRAARGDDRCLAVRARTQRDRRARRANPPRDRERNAGGGESLFRGELRWCSR